MSKPRTGASLRFIGEDLDPAYITSVLHCNPTRAARQGDPTSSGGLAHAFPTGVWCLDATGVGDASLDDQIRELLHRVSDDLVVWTLLSKRYSAELLLRMSLTSLHPGLRLSSSTLRQIAERGLSVDCYAQSDRIWDA